MTLEVKLKTLLVLTHFQSLQGSKTNQVNSVLFFQEIPGALCQPHLFLSILLQKPVCHSNIQRQHSCKLISSHMGNIGLSDLRVSLTSRMPKDSTPPCTDYHYRYLQQKYRRLLERILCDVNTVFLQMR